MESINNTATTGSYIVDIEVVIPIFSLLGIVCILSNALVCYIIVTRKLPSGVIRYYMFSLATTDILLGAICIPLYLRAEWIKFYKQISLYEQWKILHSTLLASEVLLSTSSILHLCLVAFDRVMAISKPIYHRRKLRKKSTALKLLTIPWLLAPVNAALFINLSKIHLNWAILVAVTVIFPSCFITTCYSVLLHKIRKRNRSFSKVQNMQQINEKRIIKTMLVVIVAFFICWMPVLTLSIYYTINFRHLPYTISIFFTLSAFMQYLNSACNPFIYAVFNPAFRAATTSIVPRSFRSSTNFSTSETKLGNSNAHNSFKSMETKL